MKRYVVKLKGTNCYLKNMGEKSINFTTNSNNAKVFEDNKKLDFIDKLKNGEYKVKKESHRSDHIRLTMDLNTWQDLYTNHLDELQHISDSRYRCHQYSMSFVNKFEAKTKAYNKTEEFPNFDCDYYGEDFEREYIK